jgi:hypothetical protein
MEGECTRESCCGIWTANGSSTRSNSGRNALADERSLREELAMSKQAQLPLDMRILGAVKKIRRGADRANLAIEFGMSVQNLEDVTSAYDSIPDSMLTAIERLLKDQARLRRLVSRT